MLGTSSEEFNISSSSRLGDVGRSFKNRRVRILSLFCGRKKEDAIKHWTVWHRQAMVNRTSRRTSGEDFNVCLAVTVRRRRRRRDIMSSPPTTIIEKEHWEDDNIVLLLVLLGLVLLLSSRCG